MKSIFPCYYLMGKYPSKNTVKVKYLIGSHPFSVVNVYLNSPTAFNRLMYLSLKCCLKCVIFNSAMSAF